MSRDRLGDWLESVRRPEPPKPVKRRWPTVVLYGFGGLVLGGFQWQAIEREARREADTAIDRNERRAFDRLDPRVPNTTDPVVRAGDLAALYRDGFAAADRAYKGRRVTVPLRTYTVVGNAVHWHIGQPDRPPAVVFEFDGPPPAKGAAVLWMAGTVAGCERDGAQREVAGYDFRVRLVECRTIQPPEE